MALFQPLSNMYSMRMKYILICNVFIWTTNAWLLPQAADIFNGLRLLGYKTCLDTKPV